MVQPLKAIARMRVYVWACMLLALSHTRPLHLGCHALKVTRVLGFFPVIVISPFAAAHLIVASLT